MIGFPASELQYGVLMESLEQRIQRVTREEIAIEPYDSHWPKSYQAEREHLLTCLPTDLVERIEHFGSTAVPGLAAKPVVDILVGVTCLSATRERIVPILEGQGYEYFWRPSFGDDVPPWYAWFIKRDAKSGNRTHHLHMVESSFAGHWARLLFRDYLIAHPDVAEEYGELKTALANQHPNDRVAYTERKTKFIARVTALAKHEHDAVT